MQLNIVNILSNHIFAFNLGVLVSCKKANEAWLHKTLDKFTNDFVTRDFVTRNFVTTNVSETAVFHQNNQSGQIALSNDSLW